MLYEHEKLTYKSERKEADRGNSLYRFIDFIKIDELHELTVDILNEYGTIESIEEANKVADVLIALLKKKKLLTSTTHQSFVDVLLTATFIHNLFYDKDDWKTLFDARKILEPFSREKGIANQITDTIFQTVEAQLGEDSPIPLIRPSANTPSEIFAYSVWFAKEYKPQV